MRKFTDKELEEFGKTLSLKMTMHLNMTNKGILKQAGEISGIKYSREIVTPKRNDKWGNGKAYYFIEGEKTEYSNVLDFLDALKQRILTTSK